MSFNHYQENEEQFFNDQDFFKTDKGETAAIFLSHLLFFSANLNSSLIILRRLKLKIDKIINFSLFILVILGFVSFFYWFHLRSLDNNIFLVEDLPVEIIEDSQEESSFIKLPSFSLDRYSFNAEFWQMRSPYVLFFSFSLFLLMFLVYGVSEQRRLLKKIRPLKDSVAELNKDYRSLKKFNVYNALSDEALLVLEDSYFLAKKMKQKELGTLHLFWVLCNTPKIRALFSRLSVSTKDIANILKKYLNNEDLKRKPGEKIVLSENVKEIFLSSFQDAYYNKKDGIGLLNIVLFCYEKNELLREILFELEISQSKIVNTVKWFRINDEMVEDFKKLKKASRLKPGNHMNRAYTAVATPTLDHFSRDLTRMARLSYFEPCVAREKEIVQLFNSFEGESNGVLLVGPNGVGKRSLLEGLAQLMVKEEVPEILKDKRLVELDLSRLISGTSASQAEHRMLSIINELARSKNIVLYIANIQNMMGISSGTEESLELSEVLADALSRYSNFYCIASVNSVNYTKYLEGKPISNVMNKVNVNEPDIDDAIYMIESKVA